jgi:hypothetical protein
MGALHERRHVLHEAALEDHVGERYQQGLFVDRRQEAFQRHADPVLARYHLDRAPSER